MKILKRDDGRIYGFVADMRLAELYQSIDSMSGVVFTDKRKFFLFSDNIHAEFTFEGHCFQIQPDPWENGLWVHPKDENGTYSEIDKVREWVEKRMKRQQGRSG